MTPQELYDRQRPIVDRLAEVLYLKMEHIDPGPEPPGPPDVPEWQRLTEDERGYFRTCAERLLMERELIEAYYAVGREPAG